MPSKPEGNKSELTPKSVIGGTKIIDKNKPMEKFVNRLEKSSLRIERPLNVRPPENKQAKPINKPTEKVMPGKVHDRLTFKHQDKTTNKNSSTVSSTSMVSII